MSAGLSLLKLKKKSTGLIKLVGLRKRVYTYVPVMQRFREKWTILTVTYKKGHENNTGDDSQTSLFILVTEQYNCRGRRDTEQPVHWMTTRGGHGSR